VMGSVQEGSCYSAKEAAAIAVHAEA